MSDSLPWLPLPVHEGYCCCLRSVHYQRIEHWPYCLNFPHCCGLHLEQQAPSKHTHTHTHTHKHSQPSQITPPRNPPIIQLWTSPLQCTDLIHGMTETYITMVTKDQVTDETHVSIVTITNKLRPTLPSLKMQFAHKATDISVDCLYVCSWWNDLTDGALTERMKAFQCAYTPAVEDVSEVRCTAAAPGAWQSRGNYEDEEEGQPCCYLPQACAAPRSPRCCHPGDHRMGWVSHVDWTLSHENL